jgi:hypothetical protein
MIIIGTYRAPENTFEVSERDLGLYYFDAYVMKNYIVQVFSPEGKLLNTWAPPEPNSSGGGVGWVIDKPGTYRIVISNLGPSELEVRGRFQFTHNRFQRPYARMGYVTLFLVLIYLIGILAVYIVRKLRK